MSNGLDVGPSVFQAAFVCVHAHAHMCALKCTFVYVWCVCGVHVES